MNHSAVGGGLVGQMTLLQNIEQATRLPARQPAAVRGERNHSDKLVIPISRNSTRSLSAAAGRRTGRVKYAQIVLGTRSKLTRQHAHEHRRRYRFPGMRILPSPKRSISHNESRSSTAGDDLMPSAATAGSPQANPPGRRSAATGITSSLRLCSWRRRTARLGRSRHLRSAS